MSQLTDAVRAKYPDAYKDVDDETLEKAVLEKYPMYQPYASKRYGDQNLPDETQVDNQVPELAAAKQTLSNANAFDQSLNADAAKLPTEPASVPEPTFMDKIKNVGKGLWDEANAPIALAEKVKNNMETNMTDPSGMGGLIKANGRGGIQDALAKLNAMGTGFAAGATGGVMDVLGGSKLNALFGLLSAGESAEISPALKRGLQVITKGLSAPLVAEGAKHTFSPDSTLSQRGQGLVEMAGGILPFLGGHDAPITEPTEREPITNIDNSGPPDSRAPQAINPVVVDALPPSTPILPSFKNKPRVPKALPDRPDVQFVNPETGEIFSNANQFGNNILDESGRPIAPLEGNEPLPLPTNDPRDQPNFADQVLPPKEPENIFENKIPPSNSLAEQKAKLDKFREDARLARGDDISRSIVDFPQARRPFTPADQNNLDEWFRYKRKYAQQGNQLSDEDMLNWARVHNAIKDVNIEGQVARPYKNEKLPSDEPTKDTYILPDGRRIAVSSDLHRGADTIDFTLKGGEIVKAKRAPEGTPSFGSKETTPGELPAKVLDFAKKNDVENNYSTTNEPTPRSALDRLAYTIDNNGNKLHFHDAGNRFTPEEFKDIATHPVIQKLGQMVGESLHTMTNIYPGVLKGLDKVGIGFDSGYRGVTIHNKTTGQKAILINPLQIMAMNNPDQAAAGFIHTILHEAGHLAVGAHDENFTSALANIYEKFGAERAIKAQRQFLNTVTDGAGSYHPEVQDLLSRYTESRGRSSTTSDIFSGIRSSAKDIGTGADEVSFSRKHDETGTTPFRIRQADVTPEKVRNVTAKGYKFAGLDENGDFLFKKGGPKVNPVLATEVGNTSGRKPKGPVGEKTNILHEVANLPRALMATFDFSAPLRQGIGLIHKTEFWKAIPTMIKAFGSEAVYKQTMESIAERELFRDREIRMSDGTTKIQPSIASEAGLKFTGLGGLTEREESLMSTWLEKVPGLGHGYRASERAYTVFLNKLRADTFESLVQTSKVFNKELGTNVPMMRDLAEFVNTATGRGSLGRFEHNAVTLNSILFAPRLIASRLKYLDPRFYMMANPVARREAIKSALAIMAAGNTFLGAAKLGGKALGYNVSVETNPNSADYGKLRIGNVRLDPWGGFQQYLVFVHQMLPEALHIGKPTNTGFLPLDLTTGFLGTPGGGIKSSNTGRMSSFDRPKFGQSTRADNLVRFGRKKLAPVPGFAASVLYGQTEVSGQKMNFDLPNISNMRTLPGAGKEINHFFDNSIAQRMIPLVIQDIRDVYNEDPSLIKYTIPFAGFGMGTQAYDPSQLKKARKGIY